MNSFQIQDCPWRPNLFIVGAPKCGTTALCHYLGQHPEIFVSRTKEPQFFSTDCVHGGYWAVRDPETYLALFRAGAAQAWRCEGTVWYLLSPSAARRIRACSPDARIIIVLRNPVDMVASLHAQFLFSGNESIRDFEKAYAAQAGRAQGRSVPWRAHASQGLLYSQVGRYAMQVERYFAAFPRAQIKVLIFEELIADLGSAYLEILEFLQLRAGFLPEFSIVNERHHIRSATLQRFLVKGTEIWNLPRRLPPGRLREAAVRRLAQLHAALQAFNSARGRLPPLSSALRRQIHEDFADDIGRLEILLGRDLSVWRSKNLRATNRPVHQLEAAGTPAAVSPDR